MKMINCFKCEKSLEDIGNIQPSHGVAFVTYGHYGSEYFDPIDGTSIEIVICDECLKGNEEKIYGKGD